MRLLLVRGTHRSASTHVPLILQIPVSVIVQDQVKDKQQIMTTKLVAFGLGNPSVTVPRNRERTQPGSHAQVIHG